MLSPFKPEVGKNAAEIEWYHSKMMQRRFASSVKFNRQGDPDFVTLSTEF